MKKATILILALLFTNLWAYSQQADDRSTIGNTNTIPDKIIEARAENIWREFRSAVKNSMHCNFPLETKIRYCKNNFWEGATIETMNPTTKVVKVWKTPLDYFNMLTKTFCLDNKPYDSTSIPRFIVNSFNTTCDAAGCKAIYAITQITVYRKDGTTVQTDSTTKTLTIFFKFRNDEENSWIAKISKIEVGDAFIYYPKN